MNIRTAVKNSLLVCAGIVVGTILSGAVRAQIPQMSFRQDADSISGGVHMFPGNQLLVSCNAMGATFTFFNTNTDPEAMPSWRIYCKAKE
jgi:hypothetical protein